MGENATDKTTFDDIDDFNGWTENPPLDPLLQPLSGFSAIRARLTVSYLNAAMAASATPTAYKLVHICTRASHGASLCLDTLFTNR